MKTIITTVLEYAESDLDAVGYPLLIAMREEDQADCPFRVVILNNWAEILPFTNKSDVQYIEDFIHEVRQQEFRAATDRDSFFRSIERLSRGPLRVSLSAFSDQSSNATLMLQSFSLSWITSYDHGTFDDVLQTIYRQAGSQVIVK